MRASDGSATYRRAILADAALPSSVTSAKYTGRVGGTPMQPNGPAARSQLDSARQRFNARSGPRWRFARAVTDFLRHRVCELPITVHGFEHVPHGEPLVVAAAPHRNGMDAFLLFH